MTILRALGGIISANKTNLSGGAAKKYENRKKIVKRVDSVKGL